MKVLEELAQLIGITPQHAEAALHSERAARLVLSRRRLFGATAGVTVSSLLAEGRVTSFGYPDPLASVQLVANGRVMQTWRPGERIRHYSVFNGDPERRMKIELQRVRYRGEPHKTYAIQCHQLPSFEYLIEAEKRGLPPDFGGWLRMEWHTDPNYELVA